MSWSVGTTGRMSPEIRETADEEYAHVLVDHDGVEWSVRELATPQPWARGPRCLVVSSRDCVRRVWSYPSDWRALDADALLRLGRVD